ncbi:MAG TPA: hypothetical protein VI934_03010, partial [Candidatus Nanoarchaeia archaeon]|nr:hypothetical protein [Candidatus Nanoarchaeia archaeon]
MYSAYNSYQGSRQLGYSASGLEATIKSAYHANYATGSFHATESNVAYAAAAASSNLYVTIYSESTASSPSCKATSAGSAWERSSTIYEFQPIKFLNPNRQRTAFV